MPPEQQFVSPNQMPFSTIPQSQVPQIGYAGFWIRFLALNLDNLIILIIIALPVRIITAIIWSSSQASTGSLIFMAGMSILQIVLTFTYFIFLTNRNQATFGKKLLGLRVVSEDGARLSLGKIAFRETIGKFISMLVLGIGYLMVAFTSKKQGLHDKMVGSVVLSNPAERKTWAFVVSIIFATILPAIAIIGILAAVTLASLNSARAKGADASVKANLSNVRVNAEISYDMNNNNYATVCSNQNIIATIKNVEAITKTSVICNANDISYAVYAPLKKLQAPATGWCVDSTGASRESVDPKMATVCP